MTRDEVAFAGKLLRRSGTAIYALTREAKAKGLPDTLESISGISSPLAELGHLALSGGLELTSAGRQQLSAWKARHNIEG